MPIKITKITTQDVRFPTSRHLDGSDAMNPSPDYSAAYVTIETNGEFAGHGMTFTIGRGNELCVAAIEALAPLIDGRSIESLFADMGGLWKTITGDSQLRWVGPEKGVIHLDAGGVGLCEYVQHIAMFDYVAVSASLENRVLEYVDHLHEHFVDPVVIRDGRYMAPQAPGYSITMKPKSVTEHIFPAGQAWVAST